MAGSLTIVLAAICSLVVAAVRADLIVETAQGRLNGTTLVTRNGRQIAAFMAVPYAEPPVAQLRFKNPVPKQSWTGVRDASQPGISICPQKGLPEFYQKFVSEDCLYLNVYTPALLEKRTKPLPVMAHVHGGAFSMGTSSVYVLGPQYLLDKNVILVTLSYRLGILGFLSTNNAAAPGNFGLKDQAMALRWIQDNIQYFGGDPNRVTLLGQSAGAASISFLSLSDKTNGLFHQYIMQSGLSTEPWSFTPNPGYSRYANSVGEKYNCPTTNSFEMINCLRNLTVDQLQDTDDVFDQVTQYVRIMWTPTNEPESEEAIFTGNPIKDTTEGKMKDIPVMLGSVTNEGLLFSLTLLVDPSLEKFIGAHSKEAIGALMQHFYKLDNKTADRAATLIDNFYYPPNVKNNDVLMFENSTNLYTDMLFFYSLVWNLNYLVQKQREPIYLYLFNYRGTFSYGSQFLGGNNTNFGVFHSDDLIYLYPTTPAVFLQPNDTKFNENDEKIINTMVDLWTSFTIDGCPDSNEYTDTWEPYQVRGEHIVIGNNTSPSVSIGEAFFPERMNFWRSKIEPLLPLGN